MVEPRRGYLREETDQQLTSLAVSHINQAAADEDDERERGEQQ